MSKTTQGFDPLDPKYLMYALILNADRGRLNASVNELVTELLERGQDKLVGDFIQLMGTGIILEERTHVTEDHGGPITEEEVERFIQGLGLTSDEEEEND